jgi:selenocysteine-specific elongation factor
VGDTLWLTGVNKPMRVRGLHAQNQQADRAHAGQRIALNIAGDAEKEDVTRGTGCFPSRHPNLRSASLSRCNPYAADAVAAAAYSPRRQPYHRARIAAGNDLAELVLDTPLWLADNDRLVLRDISARETLAGARVVALRPPRRGKRKPEYQQWIGALAVAESDAQALAVHLQRGAVNLPAFAWARQLSEAGLEALLKEPGFIRAGDSLLSAPVAAGWQRKLLRRLRVSRSACG